MEITKFSKWIKYAGGAPCMQTTCTGTSAVRRRCFRSHFFNLLKSRERDANKFLFPIQYSHSHMCTRYRCACAYIFYRHRRQHEMKSIRIAPDKVSSELLKSTRAWRNVWNVDVAKSTQNKYIKYTLKSISRCPILMKFILIFQHIGNISCGKCIWICRLSNRCILFTCFIEPLLVLSPNVLPFHMYEYERAASGGHICAFTLELDIHVDIAMA